MHIADWNLEAYSLPLIRPVRFGDVALTERQGVLIRLAMESGEVGWGDAAPLPGFSAENLVTARQQLERLLPVLSGREFSLSDFLTPSGVFKELLDRAGLAPSARFAVELAACEAAANLLGLALPNALHPNPVATLPINALLTDAANVTEDVARVVGQGYSTVKLKVGQLRPQEAASAVREARQTGGLDLSIRLDANRGWSWDAACLFAEELRDERIDYIEEPLKQPERLQDLAKQTGLPIALDESLSHVYVDALITDWLAAIVVKPTIVGGIAATLRLATRAHERGVRVVLSGAFESGVGMRGVAALAAATGGEAAGLDPYRLLETDVLKDQLPFDRPEVDIQALFNRRLRVAL
ncbi:o-succinylbenzoate synthase [soil metagenome]